MNYETLRKYVSTGGCASKLCSAELSEILGGLNASISTDSLLVGLDERDDAAVWRLDSDRALVMSVDFAPPVVADGCQAGALAAANALNDIYALGAHPALCLNILGIRPEIERSWYRELLAGAQERVNAAGAVIVGGHTIESAEPLYGVAVVGFGSPERLWRLNGAKPGDAVLLTKPVGCGVLFSGARNDPSLIPLITRSMDVMSGLHKEAVESLDSVRVHAATDVSGFGLAGHLLNIATASSVGITVDLDHIPLYPRVKELLNAGVTTGISDQNCQATLSSIEADEAIEVWKNRAIFDPQTAGGLVLVVDPEDADRSLGLLHDAGYKFADIIGEVLETGCGTGKRLFLRQGNG